MPLVILGHAGRGGGQEDVVDGEAPLLGRGAHLLERQVEGGERIRGRTFGEDRGQLGLVRGREPSQRGCHVEGVGPGLHRATQGTFDEVTEDPGSAARHGDVALNVVLDVGPTDRHHRHRLARGCRRSFGLVRIALGSELEQVGAHHDGRLAIGDRVMQFEEQCGPTPWQALHELRLPQRPVVVEVHQRHAARLFEDVVPAAALRHPGAVKVQIDVEVRVHCHTRRRESHSPEQRSFAQHRHEPGEALISCFELLPIRSRVEQHHADDHVADGPIAHRSAPSGSVESRHLFPDRTHLSEFAYGVAQFGHFCSNHCLQQDVTGRGRTIRC